MILPDSSHSLCNQTEMKKGRTLSIYDFDVETGAKTGQERQDQKQDRRDRGKSRTVETGAKTGQERKRTKSRTGETGAKTRQGDC